MEKVSVIICTYNRIDYLRICLEKLVEQNVLKDQYEVIIINNNSDDGTADFCHKFILENPSCEIRYYLEQKQGHTYSRNRGIAESNGTILAFLDDDAFVKEDYIFHIQMFFKEHPEADAIGGKINPVFESEKPAWMSKYLMPLVSALDLGNQITEFKGRKFPIGANMAFRRAVFVTFGNFNVELGRRGSVGLEGGDEKELFMRLKRENRCIYYVPQVEVDHVIPQRRVKIDYIKGLAIGVGTSEKKRIIQSGSVEVLKKLIEESIKIVATLLLSLHYFLTLQPAKASMIVRFRFWVNKGLISG